MRTLLELLRCNAMDELLQDTFGHTHYLSHRPDCWRSSLSWYLHRQRSKHGTFLLRPHPLGRNTATTTQKASAEPLGSTFPKVSTAMRLPGLWSLDTRTHTQTHLCLEVFLNCHDDSLLSSGLRSHNITLSRDGDLSVTRCILDRMQHLQQRRQ